MKDKFQRLMGKKSAIKRRAEAAPKPTLSKAPWECESERNNVETLAAEIEQAGGE